MRLLFRWSGWWIKIRRAQIQLVGLWINLNRSGPELTLDCLNFTEFVRRVFVENVNHAFACGYEQHPRCGLEGVRIHSARNRECLENFSTVRIDHDHHLSAAACGA